MIIKESNNFRLVGMICPDGTEYVRAEEGSDYSDIEYVYLEMRRITKTDIGAEIETYQVIAEFDARYAFLFKAMWKDIITHLTSALAGYEIAAINLQIDVQQVEKATRDRKPISRKQMSEIERGITDLNNFLFKV